MNAIVPYGMAVSFSCSQQALERNGERDNEQDFYIEQEEDDGHRVKLDRIAVVGRADRVFAAFVRHQFCRSSLSRADQLGDQQLAGSEPGRDEEHYYYRCVIRKVKF